MIAPIRLRRHIDGSFAIGLHGTIWLTATTPDLTALSACGDTRDCSGPGWLELFVAELPEPDGHIETDAAPYWNGPDDMPSFVAYHDGVETEAGEIVAAEELRVEALKMLAAVAACEQYRAERETT